MEVFDISSLQIFTPNDLDCLLCGRGELWKPEALVNHIKFDHGYTAKSPAIINVWSFLVIDGLQRFNSAFPSTVKDLLTEEGQWDVSKVRYFLPCDVDRVLATPLRSHGEATDDVRVWVGNKMDVYCVRDAYKLLVHQHSAGVGSSSGNRMSKVVWQTRTSPKFRVFGWRCLHQILPTGTALLSKRVPVDGRCVRCGEAETDMHIFKDCSWAKEYWQAIDDIEMGSDFPWLRR